jgi:hypothetical protein
VHTLDEDDAVHEDRPTTTTTTTTNTTTTKVYFPIYTPSSHIVRAEVLFYSFLTSAQNGGEHSVSQSD